MKYKVLLNILHGLVFIKRAFWALGSQIFRLFGYTALFFWKVFGYIGYKIGGFLHGAGVRSENLWFLRRDNLQIILFFSLFIICLPQTELFGQENNIDMPGQHSLAYKMTGPGEQYYGGLEELFPETSATPEGQTSPWRTGVIGQQTGVVLANGENFVSYKHSTILGNTVLSRPLILPGNISVANRKNIIEYKIEEGDSLGGIAYQFGVSINTLLWENNLTLKSVLKLGQLIRILPVSGVSHIIKKGDTLKKIASTYKAKVEEIVFFNGLEEDGSNLKVGEKIIVPNGVKVVVSQPSTSYVTTARPSSGLNPPPSNQAPSLKGFVWPTSAKYISQYFGWVHHGLDIAGPKNSPVYAAKAGTVETSQCGWNSGYGCYIIINHGGGVKTLYGHHNELLVKVGDYVETGQTIGLMGNTGKVRGVTGIHLHFEVIVNGVRKNPLLYVR